MHAATTRAPAIMLRCTHMYADPYSACVLTARAHACSLPTTGEGGGDLRAAIRWRRCARHCQERGREDGRVHHRQELGQQAARTLPHLAGGGRAAALLSAVVSLSLSPFSSLFLSALPPSTLSLSFFPFSLLAGARRSCRGQPLFRASVLCLLLVCLSFLLSCSFTLSCSFARCARGCADCVYVRQQRGRPLQGGRQGQGQDRQARCAAAAAAAAAAARAAAAPATATAAVAPGVPALRLPAAAAAAPPPAATALAVSANDSEQP
jgi:hypothetical protein